LRDYRIIYTIDKEKKEEKGPRWKKFNSTEPRMLLVLRFFMCT